MPIARSEAFQVQWRPEEPPSCAVASCAIVDDGKLNADDSYRRGSRSIGTIGGDPATRISPSGTNP